MQLLPRGLAFVESRIRLRAMKKAVPVLPGSNWSALKKASTVSVRMRIFSLVSLQTLHPTSGGNGTPLSVTATTLKRKRPSLSSTSASTSSQKGKAKEAHTALETDDITASASRKTLIPVADILAGGGDAGWKAGSVYPPSLLQSFSPSTHADSLCALLDRVSSLPSIARWSE